MSVYSNDWPEVALRVKEEAGWRCARCRHPDHPENCIVQGVARGYMPCDDQCFGHRRERSRPLWTRRKRVLTVHHMDGDKSNSAWWNLLPLCQVCHLSVQTRVAVAQTYPFHHTPWFRPYVAGYYAFVVLGEDLTREEVEARLVELLEAGQPHLDYDKPERQGRRM